MQNKQRRLWVPQINKVTFVILFILSSDVSFNCTETFVYVINSINKAFSNPKGKSKCKIHVSTSSLLDYKNRLNIFHCNLFNQISSNVKLSKHCSIRFKSFAISRDICNRCMWMKCIYFLTLWNLHTLYWLVGLNLSNEWEQCNSFQRWSSCWINCD